MGGGHPEENSRKIHSQISIMHFISRVCGLNGNVCLTRFAEREMPNMLRDQTGSTLDTIEEMFDILRG